MGAALSRDALDASNAQWLLPRHPIPNVIQRADNCWRFPQELLHHLRGMPDTTFAPVFVAPQKSKELIVILRVDRVINL